MKDIKVIQIEDLKDIKNINSTINTSIVLSIPIGMYKKSIIKIASQYGFDSPIISNESLLLFKVYDHKFADKVSVKESQDIIKKCDIAYSIYIKSSNKCTSSILLSQNTVRILKNYRDKYHFSNGDGIKEQREISGIIKLNLVSYTDGVINILADISEQSIVKGGTEDTDLVLGLGTFHTHPEEAYAKYKVKYGWPSKDDYRTFLHIFVENYGIFHIVSAREGIYIMTVNQDKTREDILKNYNEISDNILVEYDYNNKDISLENYLIEVNNKKLFTVKLLGWKDVNDPIEITWNSEKGNCFTDDSQIVNLKKIEIKTKNK
jgi:hypothetical protein